MQSDTYYPSIHFLVLIRVGSGRVGRGGWRLSQQSHFTIITITYFAITIFYIIFQKCHNQIKTLKGPDYTQITDYNIAVTGEIPVFLTSWNVLLKNMYCFLFSFSFPFFMSPTNQNLTHKRLVHTHIHKLIQSKQADCMQARRVCDCALLCPLYSTL